VSRPLNVGLIEQNIQEEVTVRREKLEDKSHDRHKEDSVDESVDRGKLEVLVLFSKNLFLRRIFLPTKSYKIALTGFLI